MSGGKDAENGISCQGMADEGNQAVVRTIIAGSRGINDWCFVERAIDRAWWPITEVISGHAFGVDRLGERWADGHNIPVEKVIPDWGRYGRAAGMIRNEMMAKIADAAIIIYDGVSSGTLNMCRMAAAMRLKHIMIVRYEPPKELDLLTKPC